MISDAFRSPWTRLFAKNLERENTVNDLANSKSKEVWTENTQEKARCVSWKDS